MKTFAVTVAVLSLGLAACQKNDAATNETAVEANAEYDVNVATNDAAAVTDLNAADNALDNAANAVDNASDAVENAATNQ